jgi:predicted Zn-dependent protease with MMP-like domain
MDMNEAEFRAIVAEAWDAVPSDWKQRLDNVALLIESEPSMEIRKEDHLTEHETLLGRYHGVPATERGASYGVGGTLPDTITLYQLPILEEAREMTDDHTSQFRSYVRKAVRETLWHEIGHYLGLSEHEVRGREHDGTNSFSSY